MYEELLKEFKIFREQVFAKFAEYDEILRTLIGSNSEKIVSTFTDENALKVIELYPTFEDVVGTYQKKGARVRYDVNAKTFLFKLTCEDQTENGTLILESWNPVEAKSIWTAIDVAHTGTIDDPIPAVAGMEYVYGKYYIEGETVYICKRIGEAEGGTIVLQFLPSQLVGQYFEAVSEV